MKHAIVILFNELYIYNNLQVYVFMEYVNSLRLCVVFFSFTHAGVLLSGIGRLYLMQLNYH